MLVELAVLAMVAAGAAAVVWWPDDQPKPAAKASPPESLALPGLPKATAPVLLPGAPGEAAKTLPANEMPPVPRRSHNNADIRFVTMMIPHHEQALVMAKLVADRGENRQLKIIADRILAAQEPEIKTLETWLTDRGLNRNSGPGHQHGMAGMQSAEALEQLTAARGAEFDRMFVTMMVEHHQGAIDMAGEVLALGVDGVLNEMASSVIVEQGAEINRMREALGARPPAS
ncbi:DUF305 domain-containing protein [Micromonospora sp. CB01531]|uniref:DUF305 domain-containing protein n=1 Tax=Micromonospora sp. CB01531 TaxID=1718947 RepID=UPI00095F5C4E|nr:DUF305 domain-containing protein [Micromonospora sp. CB01531]OKI69008.1 hypothetical protein A6A27_03950 [Micromonospora sp. CB01531]